MLVQDHTWRTTGLKKLQQPRAPLHMEEVAGEGSVLLMPMLPLQDWRGEWGGALPLPSAWLLSFPVPGCPYRPQKQRFPPHDSSPFPAITHSRGSIQTGSGTRGMGGGAVQAHQRTRVERRQVRMERRAPHSLRGRGQAGDFERSPSRVPPTAPCLGAVSVPALMCHVSGGGFPGAAARSPAKLSLRQSGSLLPELCHTLPPQPPKCGFWGESGTNWMELRAAPAGPRGQHRYRSPALASPRRGNATASQPGPLP